MITEIVFLDFQEEISREALMSKYMSTTEAWSKNEDLIQKQYFYDADQKRGGGIYMWKTKEAMNKWHGDEFKSRMKEIYGSEPQFMYFDLLVHINNLQGKIVQFEPEQQTY